MHFIAYWITMDLEHRLKEARNIIGYTQRQLAEALDIALRTYSSYEKDASNLSVGLAEKISKICKISDIWLLTGKGNIVASTDDIEVIKNTQNNGVLNYQSVGDVEYSKLIQKFKNKERAKRLNEKLIKLESLSEVQLDKVEQDLDKRIDVAEDVLTECEKKENETTEWKGEDRRKNRTG